MKFDLNFQSGIPIYIQLKEQIKYGMARGHLKPGTQLPTVRKLAIDLRINANTVSRVYSELEHEGLLATRKGKGTFVLDHNISHQRNDIEVLKTEMENLVNKARELGFTPDEISSLFSEWAKRVSDR
ncbi:GntR family transcriptional regulator [Phosphitispora fastidiosa]|uniref:GntR family transcriptional regulator n=1 Tax=Phosphitispora fastidiosa TaxID=2837202 RepID=UPI001E6217FA|nr:GntR family transcriptional regulator [Phosphitispora fastidiosa]MBU7007982.1 GntR family transcriptional regulator [Phosphitispora fastidiosa]